MSRTGLSRIRGLQPDDLFLNFDADEIPKEEAVRFIKMYKGYSEPIRNGLKAEDTLTKCFQVPLLSEKSYFWPSVSSLSFKKLGISVQGHFKG